MEDVTNDILLLFSLSEENESKHNVVVENFEAHFEKKGNAVFEWAKFNQRRQEESKPVDDFMTSLYCLSEHCWYGDPCDEMISKRIVVGLLDSTLSEKLQLKPNLTLEMAIALAPHREQV